MSYLYNARTTIFLVVNIFLIKKRESQTLYTANKYVNLCAKGRSTTFSLGCLSLPQPSTPHLVTLSHSVGDP